MPRRKSFTKANVIHALPRVVEVVKRLAAEQPDFVYRKQPTAVASCMYRPDSLNPQGCLIGAAFRECGIALNKHHEGKSIGILFDHVGVPHSKETQFLQSAQWEQDAGASWSQAVRTGQVAFDEYVDFDDAAQLEE